MNTDACNRVMHILSAFFVGYTLILYLRCLIIDIKERKDKIVLLDMILILLLVPFGIILYDLFFNPGIVNMILSALQLAWFQVLYMLLK